MNLIRFISLIIRSLEIFFHLHLLTGLITYSGVAVLLRKHLKHYQYRSVNHEKVPFEFFEAPFVSFIVPAYNEGRHLIDTIHAALSADYPNFQVVIVNDGSEDITMPLLLRHYQMLPQSMFESNARIHSSAESLDSVNQFKPNQTLSKLNVSLSQTNIRQIYRSATHSRLIVIDKPHSGKADSLNVAIDYVDSPYVCCMDADSIVTPDALRKLMTKFINQADLIALGGAISPSNEIIIRQGELVRRKTSQPVFVALQIIEYLRSMTTWRTGWSYLNGLLIIGGALTVFKKEALHQVGGYTSDTMTEDLDIILTLHEYHLNNNIPYHIWTVPDVICWTRAPKTIKTLKSQRMRWMYGALQSLNKHKGLAYHKKSFLIGWISFPHFVFIEAIAPIIEMMGLICMITAAAMGILSYEAVLVYACLVYALVGLMSWYSLAINNHFIYSFQSLRQVLRVGFIGLLEPMGYRQRDAYWRMKAWWCWLRNKPVNWR
jgi:cellulose synthase/poly-beta-1,6-N-acetylglucosamine synthase-like glycosyltransferase